MSPDGALPEKTKRPPLSTRLGLITLVYTLVHGISLLNRGLFWDDWVFWRQEPSVVAEASASMGSTWPWVINKLYFYSVPGITVNRLLTFVAMLVVSLLLFDILRRLRGIGDDAATAVALLVAIYPAYESRVAMVMVGYALSLAMFMVGLWLLVRFWPRPPVPVRLAAAVMFLASFHTGSLLVFFAVIPIALVLVEPSDVRTPGGVVRRLAPFADQLVLPVAYWAATRLWFKPSGLYAGYNVPEASAGFFGDLLEGLWVVVSGPFAKAANSLPLKMPLILALTVAVVVALALWSWRSACEPSGGARWMALGGVVLFVLAVVPYAAVGKVPGNEGWETRHQLLVPFGGALLVTAAACALWRRGGRARALSATLLLITVLGSAGIHTASQIRLERDWLKQQALMEAFAETTELEDARFILIEDQTGDLNYERRMFYEYSGMFAEVFGDQSRFGVDRDRYTGDWDEVTEHNAHVPYYKLADFEGGKPDLVITVRRGTLDLRSSAEVLRLAVLDWTDREALRSELASALVIDARPYTQADATVDAAR